MTRAPSSAISRVQYGPARMRDRSTIVIPESGPACGMLQIPYGAALSDSPEPGRIATEQRDYVDRRLGARAYCPQCRPEPCFQNNSGRLRRAEPELVCKTYELRDAAGLHFPHNLAAMHL